MSVVCQCRDAPCAGTCTFGADPNSSDPERPHPPPRPRAPFRTVPPRLPTCGNPPCGVRRSLYPHSAHPWAPHPLVLPPDACADPNISCVPNGAHNTCPDGLRHTAVPAWPTTWPDTQPVTTYEYQQAAARLVQQALAPYLIAAGPGVWFSYAYFCEDLNALPGRHSGYRKQRFRKLPNLLSHCVADAGSSTHGGCWAHSPAPLGMSSPLLPDDAITGWYPSPSRPNSTLAPPDWYPELSAKLGHPKGPASCGGDAKLEWTRDFEHASVYVDLRDRRKSKVTWREE